VYVQNQWKWEKLRECPPCEFKLTAEHLKPRFASQSEQPCLPKYTSRVSSQWMRTDKSRPTVALLGDKSSSLKLVVSNSTHLFQFLLQGYKVYTQHVTNKNRLCQLNNTMFLGGQCPVELSSNLLQLVWELLLVIMKTLISWFRCI